jgi:hypothetical protein
MDSNPPILVQTASTTTSISSSSVITNSIQSGNREISATPSGDRELIINNWSEDKDKKPYIPAHLQQRSTLQAIQEMVFMINQRKRTSPPSNPTICNQF